MSTDKITCQVCGELTHIMKTHLEKQHGPDSDQPMSLEEYREKFPDAPLLSEMAKTHLKEAKRMREEKERAESSGGIVEGKLMRPMAEVFGLGKIKAAKQRDGNPIMVQCYEYEEHKELIPDIDEGYVFNVDLLKSALMGLYAKIPSYFYGHAGVGKSTLPEQICARTRRPMIRLQHSINIEEQHILGKWTVKKHKDEDTGQLVSETVFDLGPLPLAMKNGWVFLADEFDRAHSTVLSVYQAVLEGKPLFIADADQENRIIYPHPNFAFIATGNTNGSGDDTGLYGSTLQQDAATIERFGIVNHVDYMKPSQEVAIVAQQAKLVEEDAKNIVDFCTKVRKDFPTNVSLTLGPRVAINIGKIGIMRGCFLKAIEVCYANRLPDNEKEIVMQIAQRIWGG